ncbi:hypothetical protein V8J82_10465 [Gymnodinialimonas sp. 2305UL16-5]|uniref:hypothetical protein n=1 Tax=Gymnodinialimonas mytili TaxID=3126503 RepID=UPI0030A32DD1
MTGFIRRDVPADIQVLAGDFASQPLAFAHLLDVAPGLDLGHVEVIQSGHAARLGAYFGADIVARLPQTDTLILVLPGAYSGLDCPLGTTDLLRDLGAVRGTVPQMVPAP